MMKLNPKTMKLTLRELVKLNKEELMKDSKALEKIEKRIEDKNVSSY